MKCPIHKKTNLKQAIFYNTEVDYCPEGLGVWFDKGEFRIAKDVKDKNLDWMDIDLWEDKTKLNISKEEKMCPKCDVPMYELTYDDSDIKVDICNVCEGVWLDRGEFKKIINYLREKLSDEVINNYTKTLMKETAEVFTGPESLEDEMSDVLTIIGLLRMGKMKSRIRILKEDGKICKWANSTLFYFVSSINRLKLQKVSIIIK